MTRRIRVSTPLIFLMIILFPLSLMAEDSIIWMEAEFPPGYIQQGPLSGQGYEDVITDILQENLPNYIHQQIIGNLARMYHEFRQQKNVCNVALFKTPEREKFMYFSIPSTFTLPNRLITRKKNYQKIFGNSDTTSRNTSIDSDKSAILLDGVLNTPHIKLGISRDRSYGKAVDEVLEKYKTKGNIFIHSGKDVFESLLRMVLSDRLDCMLGLPEEVIYVAEKMGVKDEIVSIGLKENENTYDSWLGYVACSKTEWGKQVIEKINHILLEKRPEEAYRKAYERWLDENSIEDYRKRYDEIFLKSNK